MADFAWTPVQWRSLNEFRQYLARLDQPKWVKGATVHHTAIPTVPQWRGMASMKGIGAHYRDTLNWSAGPHLFICVGAPDPRNDGIFLGTPLGMPGIHAGLCNSTHWGVEVVGNYDNAPWSRPLAGLVYGVLIELAQFGGFGASAIKGHRECLNNKSCPGNAIDMRVVRATVDTLLIPDFAAEFGRDDYVAHHGIETRWREHYKKLGEAIGPEKTVQIRHFAGGHILYDDGVTEVYFG